MNDVSPTEQARVDSSESNAPTAAYRCVCGATFALDGVAGVVCGACGRRFSAEVLEAAGAETLDVESLSSDSATVARSEDDELPDPRVGEKLDHFLIVRRLGQGGMGTVYKALDESLQRYVALKLIRPGESGEGDSHQMQSLVQEARAQARVSHPNVLHIYYVGRDERLPFFAMELVEKPTLAERLGEGPLPFTEVIDTGLQLVNALEHAARFDIVHGDIKPSNVLLADRETVKLSDFGLARRLSQQPDGTEGLTGTPNYLSPEAARGEPSDIRSDMYSLGITLFEMTFGRLPYSVSSGSLADKLKAHVEAPIEFPDPWPAALPKGYRQILSRLLAKRPEDRYSDYDELRRDLTQVRPVHLPPAGRVPRALAWIVDLVLATGMCAVPVAPFFIAGGMAMLEQYPGVRLPFALAGAVVPLLAMFLQAHWGTTPGKKLFQLRIVDGHGLRPSRTKLALRSVVQFFPLWAGPFGNLYAAFGLQVMAWVLLLGAFMALLIDAAMAALSPGGRSLHDIVFDTRVVIEAKG